MDLKMRIYGHFVEDKYHLAHSMGINGSWMSVDQIGFDHGQWLLESCRHYPEWRFILFIFLTENRIKNINGEWDNMLNPIRWLKGHGIHHQCAAIQFDDEFWSRLYNGMGEAHLPHWPSLEGLSQAAMWNTRYEIASHLGDRANDFRNYWQSEIGTQCPMIGMAETGGCVPPEFPGQEWWGLNTYLPDGQNPATIHNFYHYARQLTSLPLQVVLPMYCDDGYKVPPVNVLADAYLPVIEHPSTWSVGVFALDPPNPPITRNIQTLGDEYRNGLKWLNNRLNG